MCLLISYCCVIYVKICYKEFKFMILGEMGFCKINALCSENAKCNHLGFDRIEDCNKDKILGYKKIDTL